MAQDKTAQALPTSAKIGIGIVFVILGAVVGYMLFYAPAVAERDAAFDSISRKQDQLEEVKNQESAYLQFRRQNEYLEKRLEGLKAKIPSTVDELNNFLASVNQRARASKVSRWTEYRQESNISKGDYVAVPIRMEFEATYESALQFFWDLASMGDSVALGNREQLINIRDVEMTKLKNSNDTSVTMLKVSCIAETYLYTGSSAQ